MCDLELTVIELSAIAKNPGWRGTPPAMSFYFAFYVSIIYAADVEGVGSLGVL